MGDMRCGTCMYWKRHHSTKAFWGDCSLLASGDADMVDIYSNNRDGEWVEAHVETLPEFYCNEYVKREERNGTQR